MEEDCMEEDSMEEDEWKLNYLGTLWIQPYFVFIYFLLNHLFCLGKHIGRVTARLSNVDMEKANHQPPLGTLTLSLTSRPDPTATTTWSPVMP